MSYFSRLREVRKTLREVISKPEIEQFTLNNIGVSIYEATLFIDIFCPKRDTDRFLNEFKRNKEATFIFQSPFKKIEAATLRLIEQLEDSNE